MFTYSGLKTLGCAARASDNVPPAFDGRGHVRDDALQRVILRLLLQNAQPAHEWHPHFNQRRKLTGEHREDGRFDSPARHSKLQFEHFGNGKCLSLPAPEWRWLRNPGRKQPHFFDPPQRLVLIGDIQRTLGLQSAGIHSLITITGHNSLVSGTCPVLPVLLLVWTVPG
jgi:hypothetical protein